MKDKGFTLFIALIVMGTLLLVATGLVSLAVKQALVSSSGSESQEAFYVADTGIECALYWDVKSISGISAFSTTTTGSLIFCNNIGDNSSNRWMVGGSETSTFTITFRPDPHCAIVTVTKLPDETTKIESLGYNTCDVSSARRVERAIRVAY